MKTFTLEQLKEFLLANPEKLFFYSNPANEPECCVMSSFFASHGVNFTRVTPNGTIATHCDAGPVAALEVPTCKARWVARCLHYGYAGENVPEAITGAEALSHLLTIYPHLA